MSLSWIFHYIPHRHVFWVLTLAGGICFFWGAARPSREVWLTAACYTGVGFGSLWLQFRDPLLPSWPNLLAVLFLLAEQQIARRGSARFAWPERVHTALVLVGDLTLWLWVSRWILLESGQARLYLTAAWALLALAVFGAGFLLRERVDRWVGLGILACALGRVVFNDVWRLETIYRIASFMALGVVLLVLGFIYNKYQEKIRQWL